MMGDQGMNSVPSSHHSFIVPPSLSCVIFRLKKTHTIWAAILFSVTYLFFCFFSILIHHSYYSWPLYLGLIFHSVVVSIDIYRRAWYFMLKAAVFVSLCSSSSSVWAFLSACCWCLQRDSIHTITHLSICSATGRMWSIVLSFHCVSSSFCPLYFQSSSLFLLSSVLFQIDRDTYWCLLSFCSLPLPFFFVRNLLSSWNISSNLIGKNKGTSFLIVWIDQIMTKVFSGFIYTCSMGHIKPFMSNICKQ